MLFIRKTIIFIITLIIFTNCFPKFLHAGVSSAAVLFLRIVGSPQATSMGGCVANNINEQSALYSPGAFGLLHLDKNFSVSFPSKIKWLPELTDDIRLKTFGISGGYSFLVLNGDKQSKQKLSVGVAYSTLKLDYGYIARIDEQGNYLGTFNAYDNSANYSLGVGFEYYVKIGIGITYKSIESKLVALGGGTESGYSIAKGSAIDYGIMIEFPLSNITSLSSQDKTNNGINFDLVPSISYVKANIGDDIYYIDVAQADPLPKLSRTGFSIIGKVNRDSLSLFSIRFAYEIERSLYGHSKDKVFRTGYELGILGFLDCRLGHVDDDPGDIHINTYGFGISLNGITSWLNTSKSGNKNKTIKYLFDNLDVTFSYAKYADDDIEALSNTKFINISLSI